MMTVIGEGRWAVGYGICTLLRYSAERTGETELNIEEIVGKREDRHIRVCICVYIHTWQEIVIHVYKLSRKI